MSRPAVGQFHPTVEPYDSVGNEILAIHRLLGELGCASTIYRHVPGKGLGVETRHWKHCLKPATDLLLVHYTHASPLMDEVLALPLRKALIYHNVTPERFVRGLSASLTGPVREGRRRLRDFKDRVDVAVAHSDFSAADLRDAGFARVMVMPYVLRDDLYSAQPDPSVLKEFGGAGWLNLLSVGRIVPNKNLEEAILCFDYFQRHMHNRSRLILVGHARGTEAYRMRLEWLVKSLGVSGVHFTGAVNQPSLNAFYRVASAYLLTSRHEGFCVPVVEAMRHGVPVITNCAGAVAETLGGAGVRLPGAGFREIAKHLARLLGDAKLKEEVVANQNRRLEYFSGTAARGRLEHLLAAMHQP